MLRLALILFMPHFLISNVHLWEVTSALVTVVKTLILN